MPTWAEAGLWGLLAGGALLIGAGVGYFARVRQRVIAAIMAFGSGVLISARAVPAFFSRRRGGHDRDRRPTL